MEKLRYSHVVISCQKTLEFEPDGKGNLYTSCPSDYECYGCSGKFFLPPPDPRTLEKIKKYSARPWKRENNRLTWTPGVSLSGYPADYFFNMKEIEEIIATYPEEGHFWVLTNNGCELDIYKVKEDD